jgi:hypothetical protein
MSIGTNTKPETAKPSWLSIAASIAVAVLGTLQAVRPNPAPVPQPVPSPTVIVTEEIVKPVAPIIQPVNPVNPVLPPPAIVIPPKPTDPPKPINTGVTVADMHGNPLGNSVEPGQMFSVTVSPGLTLTPIPTADPRDSDVAEVAETKILATLRNGCTLQIVVTGSGAKPTVIAIKCNHAPQPPPVVVPPVVPVVPPVVDPDPVVPTPPPIVTPVLTGGVRVVILRDAMKALSQPQIAAINSPKVEELLNAKCAKDDSGKPAWHRWEMDVDVAALPAWNKLITATRAKIKSDGLTLPLLIVERGNKLHLYEITDEAAMLKTLNDAFAGGSN